MKTSDLSCGPECCDLGGRFVSTDMLCNPMIDYSQAHCSCRVSLHNGASWAASDMAQYHVSSSNQDSANLILCRPRSCGRGVRFTRHKATLWVVGVAAPLCGTIRPIILTEVFPPTKDPAPVEPSDYRGQAKGAQLWRIVPSLTQRAATGQLRLSLPEHSRS